LKLSERARILLRIVDEASEVDWATGEVRHFFVPSASPYHPDNCEWTYVAGSDASVFKSLERKGLIKVPKTTLPNKYVYVITEDGHKVNQEWNGTNED
jgi:hypothetical protein